MGINSDPAIADEAPDPGSLTVCIRCASILVFDDDLKLRALRLGELQRIKKEDPDAYVTIMLAHKTLLHTRRDA